MANGSDDATADGSKVRAVGSHRRNLADLAYDAIVEAVLDGGVHPGHRLIMDQLAEELEISRTPVRDALRRLENDGLITPAGRRGYMVREVSSEGVVQLYDAREAVEGYAARTLAGMADRCDRLKVVEAELTRAEAMNDGTPSGSLFANRLVHRSIVEAVGNPYLTAGFDNIWGHSLALYVYVRAFPVDPFAEDIRADHATLIRVLASGSSAEGETAMIAHIRDGLDRNLTGLE